jgi:hypothetical protein
MHRRYATLADNLTTSFFQAVNWLDICSRNGITLNPDKLTFGTDTVEFAGFEITMDTVQPCKRYIDAICQLQPISQMSTHGLT